MKIDTTATRVAGEICTVLESGLGVTADCRYLITAVEEAVRGCLLDPPHCEQHGSNPEERIATSIRHAVSAVLGANRISQDWIGKMASDIERAALEGLRGSPSPIRAAGVDRRRPGRSVSGERGRSPVSPK